MVAVFNNKELSVNMHKALSRGLMTLIVRQLLASRIPKSSQSIDFPEQSQPPSDELQVQISGGSESPKEGPKSPESEGMISIREKLEHAREDDVAGTWGRLCIYRVPLYLREGDDKAYLPNTVSLGPYHHGCRHLSGMERHKWRAFHQILIRTGQDAKVYFGSIRKLEKKTRACYEGKVTLGSNEFVEMMVLDGCFVLELLSGVNEGFTQLGYDWRDPVFAMRGSMHSIRRDMILLENQIPLFILDTLLGLQFGPLEKKRSVAELAVQFFDPLMQTDERPEPDGVVDEERPEPLTTSYRSRMKSLLEYTSLFDPLSDEPYLHCLHVFRQSLLGWIPKTEPRILMQRWFNSSRVSLIHCVTELKEAGIKFKKRKTDQFWDITFENGVLNIPRLLIHDGTKSLFLNLIAFERSHLDCGNEITSYVIFMDNLINSPEDVGYLHYCGIFEHWLGSDADVADLFNGLCREVVLNINNSYLSKLSRKVNQFYDQKWNTWQASLMHNYFSNPWAVISFFAAVLLLILTLAQTFYGVYGYYRPP